MSLELGKQQKAAKETNASLATLFIIKNRNYRIDRKY